MDNVDAKVEWAHLQLKKALARYRTLGLSDAVIRADVEADINENLGQDARRFVQASDFIDRLVDADRNASTRLSLEPPPPRPILKSKAAKAGK